MIKLRSINTKFWEDSFVEELPPNEKLLFIYLLTNFSTNLLGVYEITLKRISYDTGLNFETVRKGLERFRKAKKVIYEDGFIILPNFLKHQRLNSNMKIGVVKLFEQLPETLKISILGNGSQTLPNDYQTLLKGLVKYEIEIEEEIKRKKIIKKDFFETIFESFELDNRWKGIIQKWIKYKTERGQSYKETGLEGFIKKLLQLSKNDIKTAKQIIDNSIANNWAGIFEIKNNNQVSGRGKAQGISMGIGNDYEYREIDGEID